jgi:5-methylcytosine-specific restriction endonuclease McrA
VSDHTTFPIPLKRCTKCSEVKPHEMFHIMNGSKDGRMTHCKMCRSLQRKDNADARRAYVAANLEREQSRKRAWEMANRERISEKKRIYAQSHPEIARKSRRKYRSNNTQVLREKNRQWFKKNPVKVMIYNHRRRALIARIGGFYTDIDIAHMQHIQQGHCCYCGRLGQPLTLEHIIPITRKGSSNDPWNLCFACRSCNSSKGDKLLEEWTDRWYLR